VGVCSLQIRKMKSELHGFYSCKVKDNADRVVAETGCYVNIGEDVAIPLFEDTVRLHATFVVLPRFVTELNSFTNVGEGDQLKLVCRLNDDCEPQPNVLWFKDGEDITSSKYYSTAYNPKSGQCSMIVESCSRVLNEGIYTCVAAMPESNTEFVAKTFSKVRVSSSDVERSSGDEISSDEKFSPVRNRGIAPMFLQTLDDVEIEEGEDLELKCQIMGAPIPDITAYFTKDINEKSATRKLKAEIVTYNLETGICRICVAQATREHNEGYYMVRAENDAGQLTSACQVRIAPKSLPPLHVENECKPSFVTELSGESHVMDGQEVNLSCVCMAKPEPSIVWTRTDTPQHGPGVVLPVEYTSDIRSSFDASTGRCLLKITDTYPQDAGVYICSASNVHGQAETRSKVVVDSKFLVLNFQFKN
jgi:hypothetical protein